MKKFLMTILCLCCLMPTKGATAEGLGVYIAPKFIYSYASTKVHGSSDIDSTSKAKLHDNLFGGALAVGYDFNSKLNVPVRVELEYSLFNQFEDRGNVGINTGDEIGFLGKLDIQTLFVNVYYDFHNTSKFTPYIGAGIGFAFVANEANLHTQNYADQLNFDEETKTNFAWNVGLGCSYAFTEIISLDLAYRYAQFDKVKTKSARNTIHGKTDTIDAHQIMMALRFTF